MRRLPDGWSALSNCWSGDVGLAPLGLRPGGRQQIGGGTAATNRSIRPAGRCPAFAVDHVPGVEDLRGANTAGEHAWVQRPELFPFREEQQQVAVVDGGVE